MEKKQTIGCDVTSCAFNHQGQRCDLVRILFLRSISKMNTS